MTVTLSARIRAVASPLTRGMLAPLAAETRVVQFQSRLDDDDCVRVAELLNPRPDVKLRAYGSYDGSITDLEFLRFFPEIKAFSADALYNSLRDITGLRHVREDLAELGIGQTKARLDLAPLERFQSLERLWLEKQTRGLAVVAKLRSLVDLSLRSITLPDLSLLTALSRLRLLDIKLGGTKDLSLLPEIGRIEYLELWLIRGLSDLSPIEDMRHLRYLFLQALKQVDRLPSLSALAQLRGVHLETMKGLTDFAPLSTAPALEELWLVDLPQLTPERLECLVGHPTLQRLRVGTGSVKRNEAIRSLLPLADSASASWRSRVRDGTPR